MTDSPPSRPRRVIFPAAECGVPGMSIGRRFWPPALSRRRSSQEIAAYDAPFPSAEYLVAARLFPGFVPTTPDDPERQNNEHAWEVFKRWDKPFLTLFSNRDPVNRSGQRIWQKLVPGAQGQLHAVIHDAGHFLQEDKGAEVAQAIVAFMKATPIPGRE